MDVNKAVDKLVGKTEAYGDVVGGARSLKQQYEYELDSGFRLCYDMAELFQAEIDDENRSPQSGVSAEHVATVRGLVRELEAMQNKLGFR